MPGASKQGPFTADEIALLGTAPDSVIAKQLGRRVNSVTSARVHRKIKGSQEYRFWTEAEIALLGTMSDRQLAKRLGRTQANVLLCRRKHGIPVYEPHAQGTVAWTSAETKLLKSFDDLQVARMTGRLLADVRAMRKKIGEA